MKTRISTTSLFSRNTFKYSLLSIIVCLLFSMFASCQNAQSIDASKASSAESSKTDKKMNKEVKEKVDPANIKTAYFAGGCFWGVESYMEKEEGVISAVSGYMGGGKDNPTYQEVTSEDTGHLEVVAVEYDSSKAKFETLARLFFEIHDPTQTDGQGPDIGSQYLSAIFYNDDKEKEISQSLIKLLEEKGLKVATELRPKKKFFAAEDYHQDYYKKTGKKPYCHFYTKRF